MNRYSINPYCSCGAEIPAARYNLGYNTCLSCGEAAARRRTHCIVGLSKSNYIVVSDRVTLQQLNPKHYGGSDTNNKYQ